jgi:hypothetical protein
MLNKISLIILLSIGVITTSSCKKPIPKPPFSKLSLKLEPQKQVYSIGEEVIVLANLSNQSKDTLVINDRFLFGYEEEFDREIYFRIYTENGDRYDLPEDHQTCIFPVTVTLEDLKTLAPGENVHYNISLTTLSPIKDPGKYEIVGVYEAGQFNGIPNLYRARTVSQPIEIEIVK